MPSEPAPLRCLDSLRAALRKVGCWICRLLIVVGSVALLVGLLVFFQSSTVLTPTYATLLAFVVGASIIVALSNVWLKRIDDHRLLRSDEKLQNKDALVIATASLLAMHLGLCVISAGAAVLFSARSQAAAFLALNAALAAVAVGGAFGFLLGHPRRLADDAAAKDGRTGSNWLLKTGLDDIVDWLVKGLTTVLLVDSKQILTELVPLAKSVGAGIAGTSVADLPSQGYTFALALILYFTLFGAGATCLVTRTYLTGALGRADRSTVNAFSRVGLDWGEILTLVGAQRFLGSRSGELTSEIRNVAEKLAALSLVDLHTPQEYALWAKAKSALGKSEEALRGYEKAILQCDCDPALLLGYAVALSQAGDDAGAITRLEHAHLQLSDATPAEVRKNIYKSLTFALLYHPNHYDRVLALSAEYFRRPGALPSGGLRVNEVCAHGQKFRTCAEAHGLLQQRDDGILCIVPADRAQWPEPMRNALDGALQGIQTTLAQDSDWKKRFQELLVHAHPNKHTDDNDLEVFEAFAEFRLALGLPPLSPAQSTPLSPTSAVPSSGSPSDIHGTGTGEAPPTPHGESPEGRSSPKVETSEPPSQSAVDPQNPPSELPKTDMPPGTGQEH